MFLRVLNIFIQLECGASSDTRMKFRLSIVAGRRMRVNELELTSHDKYRWCISRKHCNKGTARNESTVVYPKRAMIIQFCE